EWLDLVLVEGQLWRAPTGAEAAFLRCRSRSFAGGSGFWRHDHRAYRLWFALRLLARGFLFAHAVLLVCMYLLSGELAIIRGCRDCHRILVKQSVRKDQCLTGWIDDFITHVEGVIDDDEKFSGFPVADCLNGRVIDHCIKNR